MSYLKLDIQKIF